MMGDHEADASILWRFSAFIDLTPEERRVLLGLTGSAKLLLPGRSLQDQAEKAGLYFLHAGLVLSGIDVADGSRQFLKVHRPGDIMGAPSLPFAEAVEMLTVLIPSRVSVVSRAAIGALFADWPRLGAILFLASQIERVTLMDRIVALGRLDASRNFVALLIQLFRTRPPGTMSTKLHLPLTQPQLGEVLGLSTVHVNRVVNKLERDGLIRRDGPVYELLDLPRLESLAGMPERVPERNPAWLPSPAL